MKLRRYYTEERELRDEEDCDSEMGLMNELLSINPFSLPSDCPVKIMQTSKKTHTLETVTKGKLFKDVMSICHDKNIAGGGHLSQMKRTYNLKKLERLIKANRP